MTGEPADERRLHLTDDPDGAARTTDNLVASLATRLATLLFVSGADAIGSQLAGFAALGRAASRTAEGARLRHSVARSRAGANGEALWEALRISEWLSRMPPSAVLDDVRNDLALLLAADLVETLERIGSQPPPITAPVPEAVPVTFLDSVLGLWSFGRELQRAVEALARPVPDEGGSRVVPSPEPGGDALEGPLLR